MLEDIILSDSIRYEAHTLITDMPSAEPIRIKGAFGAALLCALLVDTEEGNRRAIAIDLDEDKAEWIKRYEREVRREEWGLLPVEVDMLSDAYLAFASDDDLLSSICPNVLLAQLAFDLIAFYMRYLVVETFRPTIFEAVPFREPFAAWLLEAARLETRRQRLLAIDWTDPAIVYDLVHEISNQPINSSTNQPINSSTNQPINSSPTFVFSGHSADDVMTCYWTWLWQQVRQLASQEPNSRAALARYTKYVLAQETDLAFLQSEIDALSPDDQKHFGQWIERWNTFITRQLKPQREIRFWTNGVPQKTQTQLIEYLRLQEQSEYHYKRLASAVYALRYLGYVRRKLGDKDMRQWLSEHLNIDYTLRNTSSQYMRAWRENSRYAPFVQDHIRLLANYGINRFSAPDEE
jgi:hypothetical protein